MVSTMEKNKMGWGDEECGGEGGALSIRLVRVKLAWKAQIISVLKLC